MLIMITLLMACNESEQIGIEEQQIQTVEEDRTHVVDIYTGYTDPGPTWYEDYPCDLPANADNDFTPWAMHIGGAFFYNANEDSIMPTAPDGETPWLIVTFAEKEFFDSTITLGNGTITGDLVHARQIIIWYSDMAADTVTEYNNDLTWYGFEFPEGMVNHDEVWYDFSDELGAGWEDVHPAFSRNSAGLAVGPMDEATTGVLVDDYGVSYWTYDAIGGAGFYYDGEYTSTFGRTHMSKAIRYDTRASTSLYEVGMDLIPEKDLWTDVCKVWGI